LTLEGLMLDDCFEGGVRQALSEIEEILFSAFLLETTTMLE